MDWTAAQYVAAAKKAAYRLFHLPPRTGPEPKFTCLAYEVHPSGGAWLGEVTNHPVLFRVIIDPLNGASEYMMVRALLASRVTYEDGNEPGSVVAVLADARSDEQGLRSRALTALLDALLSETVQA